jgi:hypothetical protein
MKKTYETILDREGNAVAGAEFYVRNTSGGALATLYSDNGSTTTANPVVSDNDGFVEFYVTDGNYYFEIYVEGVEQRTITGVQIYDDADAEIAALRTLSSAADKLPYFTGAGTASLADFNSSGRSLVSLVGAADKGIQFTGAGAAALYDLTAAGKALLDDASAADQRTTLGLGTIAVLDETTTAQYRSNTADKALSTDQVWGAADYVALTPGANVAVDMSAGFNFSLAMGGNYTLDNPTNTKNGQTGAIVLTQDGTGSRTLAYGTNWHFAGGTDPTLSTAASAVDVLFYQVISSSSIVANLVKAIA